MKKFLSAFLSLSLLLSLPVWAEEPETDQPMDSAPSVESAEPVESAPCTFTDMEDHWARDVVEKYVAMGVINGYGDGTFRPDNLVTRAEAAKILTLTFGLEEPEEIRYTDLKGVEWTEYTDLKGTEWHYDYDIRAAKYLSLNVSPAWSANIELLQPYDRNFWEPNGPGTAGRFLPYANMARYQLADTLVEYLAEREGLTTTVPDSVTEGGSYTLIETAFPNENHPYIGTMPGGGISSSERRLYDRLWIAYEQGIVVGGDGYLRSFDAVTRAELLTTIDRVLARWEVPPINSPEAVDPPELEWYDGFPTEMYSSKQIIENEFCYAYLGAVGGLPDGGSTYYVSVVYKDGETAQWQYARGREVIKGVIVQSPRHSRIAFAGKPTILWVYGENGEKLAELDLEKQEVLWRYEHDRSKIFNVEPLPSVTIPNDGVFHDSPAGLNLAAGETVAFKTALTPDDATIWVRIRLSDGSQEISAILPPGEYVTLTAPVDGNYKFQFMAPTDGPAVTGGIYIKW